MEKHLPQKHLHNSRYFIKLLPTITNKTKNIMGYWWIIQLLLPYHSDPDLTWQAKINIGRHVSRKILVDIQRVFQVDRQILMERQRRNSRSIAPEFIRKHWLNLLLKITHEYGLGLCLCLVVKAGHVYSITLVEFGPVFFLAYTDRFYTCVYSYTLTVFMIAFIGNHWQGLLLCLFVKTYFQMS